MDARRLCRLPPLGPYDRFFLAGSLALMKKGLPGHHVFARLALCGRLDASGVRDRLRLVLERHAILTARIACSWLTKRPRWVHSAPAPPAAEGLSPAPFEDIDLTNTPDPVGRRDEILRSAAQERVDPYHDPLLRLWLFRFDDSRHELVIRWPHYLMDLAPMERLLAEIAGDQPPSAIDRGTPRRSVRSLAAGLRGMWHLRRINFIKASRLRISTIGPPPTVEMIWRAWSSRQTAAIDAAARRSCGAGPMLHTRWHIASLARAVEAAFTRAGAHHREQYLVSLPQTRSPSRAGGTIGGNDLTIGTLILCRDTLADSAATDRSLLAQLADRNRRSLADADEMTTAIPGVFPLPLYVWLLRKFRIFPRYSIGFSGYRAGDMSHDFLGCRIEDFSAWAVPSSPPGLVAKFCRFRDRLNFSLTYFSNACTPAIALDICDALERQLTT